MLTYIVNIPIGLDGSNANLQIDNALENVNIKGIALSPNSVTKTGVNAISSTRLNSAHLELAKGNETIIELPLKMLDMGSKKELFFPVKIPANTLSTQRSQVTFGTKTTATQIESVELVFFID